MVSPAFLLDLDATRAQLGTAALDVTAHLERTRSRLCYSCLRFGELACAWFPASRCVRGRIFRGAPVRGK